MATVLITRGTAASGAAVLNSTVALTRGTARSVTGSTARVTRGTAQSGTTAGSKARVTRGTAASNTPTALGARAGGDQFVDSFRDILLDGSRSTGSWSGATWRQVGDSRVASFNPASPTVRILGSGSQVIYRAPADHQSYQLTFELLVSDATSTSVDTRTDTVYPWPRWTLTATGLVPCGRSELT